MNMPRLTRLLVALLALLVGAAPLGECVTDEAMSGAQMACCTATDHACGTPALTEACCPTDGSSSRQLVTAATVQIHPAPLVPSGSAAWPAPAPSGPALLAAQAFDREILKLPERPTYLLVSSFLI
jgi:hypothetical protein